MEYFLEAWEILCCFNYGITEHIKEDLKDVELVSFPEQILLQVTSLPPTF